MKILILRTTPNKLDLSTYNLQEFGLAKALIRKGHQCDVAYYCGNEKDHAQEIQFDGNKKLKVLWLQGFGFLYEGFFPSLGKHIKNYDIVQVGGYVGFTSCWLNIFAKRKTVNYNGLYYCKENKGDIKKAKVFDYTLLPWQGKNTMIVATKSVLATKYLRDKGIKNVETIGVGLDLDNLLKRTDDINEHPFVEKLKEEKRSKYLLYIGTLEQRRNILFLLEVFKKVLDQMPTCKLVLIGKGKAAYTQKCFALMDTLGIKTNIIYCEKIEQRYMPDVYQLCDAFLLPTSYEIFGMVLLEAMYYGLPVFTTYNGGSSTLMNGSNGIIIDNLLVDEWASSIDKILSDEKLCRTMSDNARQTIVEGYMWDTLADRFLEVYQRRINGIHESR